MVIGTIRTRKTQQECQYPKTTALTKLEQES
jgi:hypothetical protein